MLLELRERLVARGAADAVVELVADLREPELCGPYVRMCQYAVGPCCAGARDGRCARAAHVTVGSAARTKDTTDIALKVVLSAHGLYSSTPLA